MKFETFVTGPIQVNTYMIYDEVSKEAILLDVGGSVNEIVSRIDDLDLKIKSHAEMVMIDLRTDYNDKFLGFINGTVSLPFAKFMNKIVNDADALAGFKQVPIVLIGIRDEKEIFLAYKALKERGFSDVCVLDNGITEWLRAKLPTVRPYVPKND